jgi:hypothetical protein
MKVPVNAINDRNHLRYEHVEWALQNVTDTSTADSTTHRAVGWGPYGGPRVVAAPETRIYVTL